MNTDLIGIFPSLVSNARYCAVPRQQYPAASREQCCQHGCSSIKLCYYSIVQLSILLLLLNRVKQQCNDNNSEQACSINIVFCCSNNREQLFVLHQC